MTFVGCIDEIWMDYMENSDLCRTRTLFRCWKNYASKRIDRLKVCTNEKAARKVRQTVIRLAVKKSG